MEGEPTGHLIVPTSPPTHILITIPQVMCKGTCSQMSIRMSVRVHTNENTWHTCAHIWPCAREHTRPHDHILLPWTHTRSHPMARPLLALTISGS